MDLSTDFNVVSGRTELAQSLARRWSTDPGQLIDDPLYGRNLTNLINDDMTPADIAQAQAEAELEALKDERVKGITSTARTEPDSEDGEILYIDFVVEDADGPFTLTISVSSVTVDLLTVSP